MKHYCQECLHWCPIDQQKLFGTCGMMLSTQGLTQSNQEEYDDYENLQSINLTGNSDVLVGCNFGCNHFKPLLDEWDSKKECHHC